ncbi:hypothetical protein H9655_02710 [Cytobacillus sp. Sa5YUA1]|uniref:Uncharacterized protein n=1 Tax=Cytobacillus stercorigallinarum TaxID=2762240 RepID=A0ABR8QK74_9BACI|nr:hypothetical protein [Cytobacillus stercorigallinarum]MBD7935928.1 hypothetical protein [Cytobacillus stercorigallinarum]
MTQVTLAQQEITEEGKKILQRIEHSKQPLKDISSYYEEARQLEAETRKQQEAEELANMPAPVLSPEQQQLAELTQQLAALNKKLDGVGKR